MSSISEAAQTGFAKADDYDKYRPTYPEESIETLLKSLGIHGIEGATVLDVAAGTGKFTSILSARPEKYEIIAIEPHDDMRKVLEAKKLERVTVVKGLADNMPIVESQWAQAVVVAQVRGLSGGRHAWTDFWYRHFIGMWQTRTVIKCLYETMAHKGLGNRFANMDALREFHRVLYPGGILGLIWNSEDCTLITLF